MSRKTLVLTRAAAFLAALSIASPAASGGKKESGGVQPKKNSGFCGYTFFTNADDMLDFRAGAGRRCFDMKGGDDILILNREDFSAGVEIFTGTGRDTVWTTDGPDAVHDADGRDREIRTYDGDDLITIQTKVEEDPFRGVEAMPHTDIKPGKGHNRITFGEDVYTNALTRKSPDIWLTTSAGAHDEVSGICGRPTIMGNFDFRTLEVPENSSVSFDVHGCNIGIFGLHGDADVRMKGGRLAMQTYSESFRMAMGENIPRITGEIAGGTGLTLDLDKSDPESDFSWEGQGAAFIRSRISDPESGGDFRIRSAKEVYYQGDLAAGDIHFELASREVVKIDLVSRVSAGRNRFTLAAPRMDISWRLAGKGIFPTIENDAPVSYRETRFLLPELDYRAEREPTSAQRAQAEIDDPDEVINGVLPANVPDIGEDAKDVEAVPGTTSLRLKLRRENDLFGKCMEIRVVDREGVLPERREACSSLSAPLRRLVLEKASSYEKILVSGDGVDLEIPINEASRFSVTRIEAEL